MADLLFIAWIWFIAGGIAGYLLGCRLTDQKWTDNARRDHRPQYSVDRRRPRAAP